MRFVSLFLMVVIWLAYGETDEFGFKAAENKVHVHDLHATVLHLLGIDHEQLTYHTAGRDYRLTDVHDRVEREVLALTHPSVTVSEKTETVFAVLPHGGGDRIRRFRTLRRI